MKSAKLVSTAFEQATYASQVRRLRTLALKALEAFTLKVASVEFIHHGENATFKVKATNGDRFLLRIHRKDYHSTAALRDELRWLELLAKHGLDVPCPVRGKRGSTLVVIDDPRVGTRHCDLFHWIEGRFLSKSISESDMFKIGALLARVQYVGRKIEGDHRRYWTSAGLVGPNPKFGSVDRLPGLYPAEQKKLTATRKTLFSRLKAYEKRCPEKMGMIHADLHFGNLLKTKTGEIAAIDFDDSGFGFYVYDLVIPLIGVEYHLRRHKLFRSYPRLKKALLDGYRSVAELTGRDLSLLQDLIIARKLLMVGWLQSRSDNPKIAGRVRQYARQTLKYVAKPNL